MKTSIQGQQYISSRGSRDLYLIITEFYTKFQAFINVIEDIGYDDYEQLLKREACDMWHKYIK